MSPSWSVRDVRHGGMFGRMDVHKLVEAPGSMSSRGLALYECDALERSDINLITRLPHHWLTAFDLRRWPWDQILISSRSPEGVRRSFLCPGQTVRNRFSATFLGIFLECRGCPQSDPGHPQAGATCTHLFHTMTRIFSVRERRKWRGSRPRPIPRPPFR